MEKNTGEIILHSRFRPLAGFMFLFSIMNLYLANDKSEFPSPCGVYVSFLGCDVAHADLLFSFRPLAGFMFLFDLDVLRTNQQWSCFRPLAGFMFLFVSMKRYISHGIWSFRPLAGFMFLFKEQEEKSIKK